MSEDSLRVLVVDDSALYRQMLQNLLRRIPGVEVVGTASDGREALELVERLRPHLTTLDVQMPTMDGLEFLRNLRQRRLPTGAIMVSSLTSQGAKVTTDALLEGAFDFILKPVGNDLIAGRETLLRELAAKIAAFRGAATAAKPPAAHTPPDAPRRPAAPAGATGSAIVIGTSTGGPAALRAVIPLLPATLPVPVVIVQHIPAAFSGPLAMRLDEASPLEVVEAAEGMTVQPGRVIVAAGGKHLALLKRGDKVACALSEDPPRHGCRPSVDVLLESAVAAYPAGITAVILTGMGRDGADGCALVKRHGGRVVAQAAEGCAVYGMPKAVVEGGHADLVVPLERVAETILAATRPA